MTQENHDIMEEMYIFLYEANKDNDVRDYRGVGDKVLIYPTYSVNTSSDDLFPIPLKSASFPSDSSLLSLAATFGLSGPFQSTGTHLIIGIFGAIAEKQHVLIDSIFTSFVKTHGRTRAIKASPEHISENYRKL
jgi:hypothetical protein